LAALSFFDQLSSLLCWSWYWLSYFLHLLPFHSWMALEFSWAALNSSFSWSKRFLIRCCTVFILIIHQFNYPKSSWVQWQFWHQFLVTGLIIERFLIPITLDYR
jgi:hypothetical protein